MKKTSLVIVVPVIALSLVIALGVLYKMKLMNGGAYMAPAQSVTEETVPVSDIEKELNNTPDLSADQDLKEIDSDLKAL